MSAIARPWRVERLTRRTPGLGGKAWEGTVRALTALEKSVFPKSECLDFALELAKASTVAWVVVGEDGAILGDLLLCVRGSQVRIHKVCVGKEWRRQGLATALMEVALAYIDETGKECDLFVDDTRVEAIALYTRHEFVAVKHLDDYYGRDRHAQQMARRARI